MFIFANMNEVPKSRDINVLIHVRTLLIVLILELPIVAYLFS